MIIIIIIIKVITRKKGDLISNEKQLTTIMNNFFINITQDLELKGAVPLLWRMP